MVFIAARFAYMDYRLRYLRRAHRRWLAAVLKKNDAEPLTVEDLPYLRRVLLEAGVGVEQVSFPQVDMVGYGFVHQGSLPLLDNLLVPQKRIAEAVNQKMYEAIGAYRMKRNDSVNPVRWAITLWTLPKAVAKTLGANQEAWPVKVIQVVYQVAVVVGIVGQVWSAIAKNGA